MPVERAETAAADRHRAGGSVQSKAEYPVREYIGAMAVELAQMARWDGDEALARILDSARPWRRSGSSAPRWKRRSQRGPGRPRRSWT